MNQKNLLLLLIGFVCVIVASCVSRSTIDFSADDDWIAFVCGNYNVENKHNKLYLLNLTENSDALVLITDFNLSRSVRNLPSLLSHPSWSPDGNMIAFNSDDEIHLINPDGENRNILIRNQLAFYPSWSPDGEWIAFASNMSRTWDLYRVPATGGEVERITHSAHTLSRPAWSPDGNMIAFTSDDNIYIINLTTDEIRQLEDVDTISPIITWSPDGEWIAFVHREMTDESVVFDELYRLRLSDNYVEKVTQELIRVEAPSWSPDGQWITFAATTDWRINRSLYRIRPDGSDLELLYASSDCAAGSSTWYMGSQK